MNPIIKNNDDRLNELTDLIVKLSKEMNIIKNENMQLKNEEIINLKNEIKQLNDKYKNLENKEIQLNNENIKLKKENIIIKGKETQIMKVNAELKNDIDFLKNENTQLKNDISFLKNEVNKLKNDNNQLKNDNIQIKDNSTRLKNENIQLKNEVIELKEKLNILRSWRDNLIIHNLDSKIINDNKTYNEMLKNWINSERKIKAELLYRLSENGDNISTFHELCDNKGPTLTLFHVNDGNIVGIYTPLSWESPTSIKEKNDMDTFIFNLNKNQKYKKLKDDKSIFCNSSYGTWTACFGVRNLNNSMRKITHKANFINKYYDNGSEILPSNNNEVIYDLIELEIYKITIK